MLNSCRKHGDEPFSYSEILAYCQLYDYKLDAWEVTALKAMDRIYIKAVRENEEG
jgi:hypothetical protein